MTNKLELFCDADGVIFDFDTVVTQLLSLAEGETLSTLPKERKSQAWARITNASKNLQFWSVMPLMPDAQELLDVILPMKPTILTAMGHSGFALQEKAISFQRHFGNIPTIFVNRSKEKARFALPNRILIDDRLKSIEPWIEAGGIGIHHTSAESTIAQLQTILANHNQN